MPPSQSTKYIRNVITSAARPWLNEIGDDPSVVLEEQGLGSGINWCGRDPASVALKATYTFLH
eukprot:11535040-Karenia_brevis.AAC.1